jgi:putative transcriptional regulator
MNNKKRKIGREIIEGLQEALAHQRGEITLRSSEVELPDAPHEYTGSEVREVRARLHFSQAVMARYMGVSDATVRSWEQGQKKPAATACRLLEILATQPGIVEKTLGMRKRRAG